MKVALRPTWKGNLFWLFQHGIAPLEYAIARHHEHSFANTAYKAGAYLVDRI